MVSYEDYLKELERIAEDRKNESTIPLVNKITSLKTELADIQQKNNELLSNLNGLRNEYSELKRQQEQEQEENARKVAVEKQRLEREENARKAVAEKQRLEQEEAYRQLQWEHEEKQRLEREAKDKAKEKKKLILWIVLGGLIGGFIVALIPNDALHNYEHHLGMIAALVVPIAVPLIAIIYFFFLDQEKDMYPQNRGGAGGATGCVSLVVVSIAGVIIVNMIANATTVGGIIWGAVTGFMYFVVIHKVKKKSQKKE